jgi:hypothetical protein
MFSMAMDPSWLPPSDAARPCDAPVDSKVACENTQPGNPDSEWQVKVAGDSTIHGYATFSATGLIDCGNWGVSASCPVPASAVSGVYLARLVRTDNSGASAIPFLARDDAARSDVLFHTSDSPWQARNNYGGMRSRSDVAGTIPSVHFFKGSTPVPVTAKTTFFVSYYVPVGFHSSTSDYFNGSADNVPLHGLVNGFDGLNGIYAYGASRFPTNSFRSTNYWVDVVFNRS